ncbi:MAG: hypothetical protein KJ941_07575 [Bacteroidetes bacterium]|nr:hypothetical protein [Bacteroidota bacterium]
MKQICDYCGKEKKEVGFFIGASKEPAWTMIEGTGKMTCPDCFEKAVKEGQQAIHGHIKHHNARQAI